MMPFLKDINLKIKSRTKEQWVRHAKSFLESGRAYIQENGEIGFVLAFILGIFVVVFFKIAFAIFFIAALAAAMIWCLADSEIERKNSSPQAAEDEINPNIQ
jgi:hypothetical protein